MASLRIFLDMDEVITDFVGAACKIWGTTREAVEKLWVPGRWDMVPFLSKACGMTKTMPDDEFWQVINEREEFWAGLEMLPWAEAVLDMVGELTEDWYIVTAPSMCPTSYAGKVRWIKSRMGPRFNRFILTRHKHVLAGPGTVLIDDRDRNVNEFSEAGGRGVLFPRINNSQHAWASDPVAYLKEQLTRLPPFKERVRRAIEDTL